MRKWFADGGEMTLVMMRRLMTKVQRTVWVRTAASKMLVTLQEVSDKIANTTLHLVDFRVQRFCKNRQLDRHERK